MLFTTFLLLTSIAAALALAIVLLVRWRSVPDVPLHVPLGPVVVAAVTAFLVGLGFMVI